METIKFMISEDENGYLSISPMKDTGTLGAKLPPLEVLKLTKELNKNAMGFDWAVNEVCNRYMADPYPDFSFADCYKALKEASEKNQFQQACYVEINQDGECIPTFECFERLSVNELLEMIDADLIEMGWKDEIQNF